MAEVVPKAAGRAGVKAKAVDADAEVEAGEAAVAVVVVVVLRAMDRAGVDVGVAAEVGSVRADPMWNRSKTATFPANQDKGYWNFIRMATASYAVPITITLASAAIRLSPER